MALKFRKRFVNSALLTLLGLASAGAFAQADTMAGTAQKLAGKFASAEETLEYHFMLKVPTITDETRERVFADLVKALQPVATVEKLSGPKFGAYIDSKDRTLDKSHLILRLRPGQLTVKARATVLNELVDLEPCTGQKNKYERDYFEEPGYSISAEYKFKKEDWIADPTKATVGQTMNFMQEKCPNLLRQLEPLLKAIETLSAPGTAHMYSAEIKVDHPVSASFKESGFALWTFPGSTYALAEIAWTGRAKDKAALEELYAATREKLAKLGLLSENQSSKTEQYFFAYFGARIKDAKK